MTLKYFIVEIFLVVIFLSSNLFAQLKVENLKCEYKSNPLGISELKPRLSWILTSSERSQYQSSYQILVSSSIDKLNNGDGDLWDSKRQISDENTNAVYFKLNKDINLIEKYWNSKKERFHILSREWV